VNLFLSTYVHKIDKKGRVSLPASFRQVLQKQGVEQVAVITSFQKNALEALSWERIKELSEVIDTMGVYSTAQQDLASVLLSDIRLLGIDSDGRINLSDDLIHHAQLLDQAAFVGKGKTFEIWSPEAYNIVLQGARERLRQSELSLKIDSVKKENI
jgi:MraZ protein